MSLQQQDSTHRALGLWLLSQQQQQVPQYEKQQAPLPLQGMQKPETLQQPGLRERFQTSATVVLLLLPLPHEQQLPVLLLEVHCSVQQELPAQELLLQQQ